MFLKKILKFYKRHVILGCFCTIFLTVLFVEGANYLFISKASNKTQINKNVYQGEFVQNTLGEDENNPLINADADYAKSVFFHGPRDKKQIALTFDADMTVGMKELLVAGRVKSYYDKGLISYLEASHTKATLFLTGMWMEIYPDVTKELAENPLFELGNHSYSHPSFAGYCYGLPQRPRDQLIEEVALPEQMLRRYTGKENKYFRFPGGCFDKTGIELAHLAGDTIIQWDVVGGDGFNYSEKAIENNVLSTVQNGSIIVMHMNGAPNEPETAQAVKVIVPVLKARGYEFVTVSDLLNK